MIKEEQRLKSYCKGKIMFGFNKDREYLDCEWMKHSIHFFYDNIRMCCSNVMGVVFYDDYAGTEIDWDKIYKIRKDTVNEINKGHFPKGCEGCCEVGSCLKKEKVKDFKNTITKVYIQNSMSCNAKCIYCAFGNKGTGCRYYVLPHIKTLIKKGILAKNASVYMSGGEITILPEFEDLLFTLLEYVTTPVEIFTSGIKYCKSIEQAFVKDKCSLLISIDSSCAETYKKIKQVDCFDTVINNLRNYISVSENAKRRITLKYIIVDDINDNETELLNFVKLVKSLGIENIRMDFDFVKYRYEKGVKIPDKYYELFDLFNKEAEKEGLNVRKYEQIENILAKKL